MHVAGIVTYRVATDADYPNGTSVVVRVLDGYPNFLVSDMGLGYEEAEMMGASSIYMRNARSIAEAAGVRFDNQAFFVLEASREQLAGAIVTIANRSQVSASSRNRSSAKGPGEK